MPSAVNAKKILIVEDTVALLKVFSLKLKSAGFVTVGVMDGDAALQILGKEKFDLILLDLMLPKVNGYDVLSEMRKRGDTTPVVIMSNLGQPEDLERTRALGIKDYFIKSKISVSDMVDRIQQYWK